MNNLPFLPEGSNVTRYSGGGKLGKQWSKDGQCKVLLDWISKVKEEYPDLQFGRRGVAPPVTYYANLFRDSHFIPVFGSSYKKMDKSTKTQLWRYTIYNHGCIGFGKFKKYQQDFDPYRGILQNAFNDVSYRRKQIVAAVDKIHLEEKQMAEASSKIQNASMTSESYQELLAYAKPNNRTNSRGRFYHNKSFSSLWPSEATAFHEALDSKLHLMAQRFGDNSGTEERTNQKTQLVQQVNTSTGSQEEIRAASWKGSIRSKSKKDFMARYSIKMVPNNQPYWTSQSGDTIVRMRNEPWCIKGHPGAIEVDTSDLTLYDENNPRLQNIFTDLSSRISNECPGMRELVLRGNFNKVYVFYAWVSIKNGGHLNTRMVVNKNHQKRIDAVTTKDIFSVTHKDIASLLRLMYQGDFESLRQSIRKDAKQYSRQSGISMLSKLVPGSQELFEQIVVSGGYIGLIAQYVLMKTESVGLCNEPKSTIEVTETVVEEWVNGYGVTVDQNTYEAGKYTFDVPRRFADLITKADKTKVNRKYAPGLRRLILEAGGCNSKKLKRLENNMLKYYQS